MKNKSLVLYEMLITVIVVYFGFKMLDSPRYSDFDAYMVIIHLCAGIILCNLIADSYEDRLMEGSIMDITEANFNKMQFYSYFSVMIPYIVVFAVMSYSCRTIRGCYVSLRYAIYLGTSISLFYLFIEKMLLGAFNMRNSPRYDILKGTIIYPESYYKEIARRGRHINIHIDWRL